MIAAEKVQPLPGWLSGHLANPPTRRSCVDRMKLLFLFTFVYWNTPNSCNQRGGKVTWTFILFCKRFGFGFGFFVFAQTVKYIYINMRHQTKRIQSGELVRVGAVLKM